MADPTPSASAGPDSPPAPDSPASPASPDSLGSVASARSPTAAARLPTFLVFALLSGVCFFATFGLRPLEEHDTLRFPEVAREILETGDWAVLHLHGVPYLLKPPLQFWVVALTAKAAGGVHPWVARLPSVLAGWGMVLLTAWIGTSLAGARAGYFSAAILGTGTLFFTMSQMSRLDPLYAFFLVLAFALWVRWRGKPEAWLGAPGIARAVALFACLGVSTLVKGPMGWLFVLPVIGADAALRRDRSLFRPLPLLCGFALYAALLLPWVLPVLGEIGWTEARELVEGEIGDRLSGGQNYDQPWYHYLRGVPIDFLPWSWFFPAAAWIAWRARRRAAARSVGDVGAAAAVATRSAGDIGASADAASPAVAPAFVLLWAFLPLVLLSFAISKNTRYLLPCFPAYALLVGIPLARAWDDAEALDTPLCAWTLAIPIAALGLGATGPFWFRVDGPPALSWIAGVVLVVGALVALRGDRRRRFAGSLVWVALMALFWFQVRNVNLAFRESPRGSYAKAAARIREATGNRPLVAWRFGEEAVEFYFGRIIPQVDSPERLAAFLRDHPDARVLAQPHSVATLPEVPGFRFEVRARIDDRPKQPFLLMEPVAAGD